MAGADVGFREEGEASRGRPVRRGLADRQEQVGETELSLVAGGSP